MGNKNMHSKLYKYYPKQSSKDILFDWRKRCLEIFMNCYKSLNNGKVYFNKTKDIKIMPLNQQISESIVDLGMIQKLLISVDHLGPDSYTNQFQFYRDMKILWKKSRNFKYFNRIITKPINKGFKTFKKEWDRLFIKKKPLEHKISLNKISDDSRKKKKKKARNRKIIYHNSSYKFKKIK